MNLNCEGGSVMQHGQLDTIASKPLSQQQQVTHDTFQLDVNGHHPLWIHVSREL